MRSSSLILYPSSLAIVVLLLVGLILAAPLLQGETLCTDDGALHVYRTVALDRAIRDGLLYPRWFPDLAYGYGFPFFVYREPLGYYAMESLHLLGVSIPDAFNLVLAGSLVLSGLAMFLLARDIFGARGGLLAGLVYVGAPYLLIGPLTRGNLPEVIAFALMPLILFFFRRLVVLGQTRYFIASSLSYAALFLTHNISSLLFTPLLVAYVALLGWLNRAAERQQTTGGITFHACPRSEAERASRFTPALALQARAFHALLAIILALGLTAFFWLPALAEQDQVQLYLTHSTRGNDYHFNFIDLGKLLGGPGVSDPKLLNPPLRIFFGWPQLALALIGTLSVAALKRRPAGAPAEGIQNEADEAPRRRERRATIIAAAIVTAGLAFMALPASLPVWDNLPLIRFVQFPWRFVGRAMLPAALLAGAVFRQDDPVDHQGAKTPRKRWGFVPAWSFGVAVFVVLLFTAPLSYPRLCPTPHDLDINDVFEYERVTGHIGVDPLGAYLPRTVIERPTGSLLQAQYSAGRPIERFDAASLPTGARILDARYAPNHADLTISTPAPFTATYFAFAFPGWSVSIDDRLIAARPSQPAGLLTFDVPAGQHRIRIAFGDSPQRAMANSVSLIALIVTAVVTVLIRRQSSRTPTAGDTPHASRFTFHASRFTLHASAAAIAFILAKALLIDPGLTPLRATRLSGETLGSVSHPLDITFGDQLRLLGYEVTPAQARPGDWVRVDLYWKALRLLDATHQAEVGIADADGWPWSPKHAERPHDYAAAPLTTLWPVDAYAIDSFEFEVLPGTPPGDYVLVTHLFDRVTLQPLQPSLPSLPGRAAPLGSIRIEPAARAFSAEQLRIYGGERIALDADLTLLGYNIDRFDTVPGESVLLTFFWQAERAPQADRRLGVELVGPAGEVLAFQDVLIGGERYPTSRWRAGEQIISLVVMRVPAAAASGEYHWRGTLIGSSASFDMRPAFRVAAPERTFDVPPIQKPLGVQLGDLATLLGFDLAGTAVTPGDPLRLTLYWQPRTETATGYKVFVHVMDAGGTIVAQADAVPGSGARPTTGWLPGEVIVDPYTILLPGSLPAGQYQVVTGLYDPDERTRLKTSEGKEVIQLTHIQVE